jgi:hypothetical protein
MSRATAILRSGDDSPTMGTLTGGHLGASAACARCGKPDVTWVPDSLYGGGWDRCGACGFKRRVPLRLASDLPPEPPLAVGSLAHFNAPAAISPLHVAAGRIGNVSSTISRRRRIDEDARQCVDAIPAEWTRADLVGKELGLMPTAWSNRLARLMSLGLVQRELQTVDTPRGRRQLAMIRRVGP